MANTQPTTKELVEVHYAYEIEMLEFCYDMLDKSKDKVHFAYRDSFALHARALMEFYCKDKGAKKHAPSYDPKRFADSSEKNGWRQKLNNQFAHLMDCRTAEETKQMLQDEQFEIYQALYNESIAFRKALLKDEPSLAVPIISPRLKPSNTLSPSSVFQIVGTGGSPTTLT